MRVAGIRLRSYLEEGNVLTNRRTRLEIIMDMLRTIRDGTDRPTRIMYNMNMSWISVQALLSKLVNEGHIKLIKKQGPKRVQRRYEITKKGLKVIDYLKGAEGLIKLS